MWFIDILTRVGQYAYGQANAAYVMLTDALGTPLATNAGALTTFETAAMGYDPSIGRTPVELSNNSAPVLLTNATVSAQVKAAPGFLHAVNISVIGANAQATHLVLYDNTVSSGTLVHVIPLPAPGAPFPPVVLDTLLSAGLTVIAATVSTAGAITPASSITGMAIFASLSYR